MEFNLHKLIAAVLAAATFFVISTTLAIGYLGREDAVRLVVLP